MDGQRQKSSGGRRRRRKPRAEPKESAEPVLIAARRPNSPMLSNGNGRKLVAASASPQRTSSPRKPKGEASVKQERRPEGGNQKRGVRIVQLAQDDNDETEKRRRRLLGRLMESDGRGAISRAAEEYREAGFDFPQKQDVQLQLLEHFNEARAREAIGILSRLLEQEAPIKKPILNQRLRRLEEYADEAATRQAAAMLRRTIRV